MATEQKEISDPCAKYNEQTNFLSKTIFASRWLQVPIYLGLIVVQGIYAYKFMKTCGISSPMLIKWMRTPLCSPYSISLMW